MEQNFGKSAPFSLGVEEEFQILNRESYELVSRIDEILLAFLPPLAAFEVFLVRGALQPAFGALIPILTCIFFVSVRKPAGEVGGA